MMGKSTVLTLLFLAGILSFSCNGGGKTNKEEMKVSENSNAVTPNTDNRVSLHLNPLQKQKQLKMMRNHLASIQKIIGLLAEEKYDEASRIASAKLGSTPEMTKMCSSYGNEEFANIGLNFHTSADKMSEIFKEKNESSSLEALANTMNYCVQCHAAFKQ